MTTRGKDRGGHPVQAELPLASANQLTDDDSYVSASQPAAAPEARATDRDGAAQSIGSILNSPSRQAVQDAVRTAPRDVFAWIDIAALIDGFREAAVNGENSNERGTRGASRDREADRSMGRRDPRGDRMGRRRGSSQGQNGRRESGAE